MKKLLMTTVAMFVIAGCGGGSDGDASTAGAGSASSSSDQASSVPVSIDLATPVSEIPKSADELQACVAIESIALLDVAGKIVELTTQSMNNPKELSSDQCIPADSDIPTYSDGTPQFIVIDLYDITGVDLVQLITDQLIPVGEYVSLALNVAEGSYGDILDTPYSYVGNLVDKQALEVIDEVTIEGLNINIDVPETYTINFDLRSLIYLINDAYTIKADALYLAENIISGEIWGDVDTSSCPGGDLDNAYVYIYDADTDSYGDLGSDAEPYKTVKVGEDSSYSAKYVEEGDYDVVLVCEALLDLPNEVDLDIDLDGDSNKYLNQSVIAGTQTYLAL